MAASGMALLHPQYWGRAEWLCAVPLALISFISILVLTNHAPCLATPDGELLGFGHADGIYLAYQWFDDPAVGGFGGGVSDGPWNRATFMVWVDAPIPAKVFTWFIPPVPGSPKPLKPFNEGGVVAVAAWLPAVLFAWGFVWSMARRIRRCPVVGEGHCDRCGYDLRGSPDRCPECGRPAGGGTT